MGGRIKRTHLENPPNDSRGGFSFQDKDPNEIKPAVINAIVEPTAACVSRAWGGSRME